MSDLISVIIPVFNVAEYIDKCLKSVLNNTYRNIEVICVNDGSTDNSLEILRRYERDDSRVLIIDKQNNGVSSARNAGLRKAAGKWISFVDSDDWIHPQFFEVLTSIADKTNADIVIGNHIRAKTFEDPKRININEVTYKKATVEMIYLNRNMKSFVWGKLYKSNLLTDLWFDEGIALGEDTLYNAHIYCNAEKLNIIYTDEQLYYYTDRESSVVNQADNTEKVKQGEAYFLTFRASDDEHIKRICLTEGFKRIMLARYTEMYTKKRPEVISQCNRILKSNINNLLKNKKISSKDKLIYTVFTYIPGFYRYFRIKDDPTMKLWEKQQAEYYGR